MKQIWSMDIRLQSHITGHRTFRNSLVYCCPFVFGRLQNNKAGTQNIARLRADGETAFDAGMFDIVSHTTLPKGVGIPAWQLFWGTEQCIGRTIGYRLNVKASKLLFLDISRYHPREQLISTRSSLSLCRAPGPSICVSIGRPHQRRHGRPA